jgi:hypothetical protein
MTPGGPLFVRPTMLSITLPEPLSYLRGARAAADVNLGLPVNVKEHVAG